MRVGEPTLVTNIVATMLVYGVPRLLTFNGGDFQRFGSLITVEDGSPAVDSPRRARSSRV